MADAAGDLFGTTTGGGAAGGGTAFEIKKTAAGYAGTPTILVSFNNASEITPTSALVADLPGTCSMTINGGWVFEITPTAPNFFNDDDKADILWRNTNGDVELWNSNSGLASFAGQNLGIVGGDWQIAGTGDFNGASEAGVLWRNADGDTELWNANGSGGFVGQDRASSRQAGRSPGPVTSKAKAF